MHTYQVKTGPTKGTLSGVTSNGIFTYTPNTCATGTDTIVWDVLCDGDIVGEEITTINITGFLGRVDELLEERCVAGELFEVYVDTNACSPSYQEELLVPAGLCPCDIVVEVAIPEGTLAPVKIEAISADLPIESFFEGDGVNFTVYLRSIKDGETHNYSIVVTDGTGSLVGTHCITNYKCCD